MAPPVVHMLLIWAACNAACVPPLTQAAHRRRGISQAAYWRSCASSDPVFVIQQVDIMPDTAIPQGGSLQLVMTGFSKGPVTAGTATVSVYYWGVKVLTASDTLCTAAPQVAAAQQGRTSNRLRTLHDLQQRPLPAFTSSSSSSSSSSASSSKHQLWPTHAGLHEGATCTMPAGPLQLQHAATLPSIAPKGSYSMRLQAADAVTGQELMCVDVWFRVKW